MDCRAVQGRDHPRCRHLLVVLFVVFGWSKLANYSGTVGYMARVSLAKSLIWQVCRADTRHLGAFSSSLFKINSQ
jgi:uncharacterized membrane protein YphA (DoxX/SURF4 family)